MDWCHEVSSEWAEARKRVIGATDIKELKVGFDKLSKAKREGMEIIPKFAAKIASKRMPDSQELVSYGARARGHVLEPYAVKAYNAHVDSQESPHLKMHHWDDFLIERDGVGFSPDAMDFEQRKYFGDEVCAFVDVDAGMLFGERGEHSLPTRILEVKSYEAKHHYEAMAANSKKLDERFQLATAMWVCPTIEEAVLFFYNPSVPHQGFFRNYTRSDLKEEIEIVDSIIEAYKKQVLLFDGIPNMAPSTKAEAEIWEETMKETWE